MALWSYAGDALWILALSIMVAASRAAAKHVPPQTRLRMLGLGVSRNIILWGLPVAGFLASLWLLYAARTRPVTTDQAIILFGIRAIAASSLAMLHLRWIGAALDAVNKDGPPRP